MLRRLWAIFLLIINISLETMNSKKLINAYLITILISSVSSCKNQDNTGQSGPGMGVPVIAYTVNEENVVYYDSYPATVMALNEVQLRSEVSGYITGLYFKEGSHVNITAYLTS